MSGHAKARGPRWVVSPDERGSRLDKFLASADRLGSRGRATTALAKGKVFLNDREAALRDGGVRVERGDVVVVWTDRPGTSRRADAAGDFGNISLVYEDKAIVVVNKPAGLLAVPLRQRSEAPSAFDYVARRLRGRRVPFVVHRIDRDTSGLVVFAADVRSQEALKDQFERREPERVYWAVVHGSPGRREGTWRDQLVWDREQLLQKRAHPDESRQKEAVTHYRVLESFPGASWLEVRLDTGKRNQIRVQARLHGCTLVGERLYVRRSDAPRPIEFSRQALHACRLSFRHPVTGTRMTFEAPMPDDLRSLIERLRSGSV